MKLGIMDVAMNWQINILHSHVYGWLVSPDPSHTRRQNTEVVVFLMILNGLKNMPLFLYRHRHW